MKPIFRRAVVQGSAIALAAPLVARYAHAAQVSWRFGHVAPESTPLHLRLLEAAEAIGKRSEGRMELKVLGEGKAGNQSGLLGQVRKGGLEMTAANGALLGPVMSLAMVPTLGFLFGDYASVWPAMDGELGAAVRAQIPAQVGVEALEKIWDFGFRQITTSSRPIRTAADLAGMKIRTQIDVDQMDMFRALQALPVAITLPFLRTALQRNQIDGQEGMLPMVEFARLNEVQPYCSMTNHVWDGFWICINTASWKKLPERLQGIVANTLNGIAPKQREDNAKAENRVRESLARTGMKFSDVDVASFRNALRQSGYYAGLKAKLGEPVWKTIEKTTGIRA